MLVLKYLTVSITVYSGGNLCIFKHLNVYQWRTMYVSLTLLRFHITAKMRVSCINWYGKQSSNRSDWDLCNDIEAVKENILERRSDEICKGCLMSVRFRGKPYVREWLSFSLSLMHSSWFHIVTSFPMFFLNHSSASVVEMFWPHY